MPSQLKVLLWPNKHIEELHHEMLILALQPPYSKSLDSLLNIQITRVVLKQRLIESSLGNLLHLEALLARDIEEAHVELLLPRPDKNIEAFLVGVVGWVQTSQQRDRVSAPNKAHGIDGVDDTAAGLDSLITLVDVLLHDPDDIRVRIIRHDDLMRTKDSSDETRKTSGSTKFKNRLALHS
ncbi:hypothetical protein HG531_005437 [Fusarium graminearum]|nr:hypothetical protein HG531_005437 [Fusarium graminearum]